MTKTTTHTYSRKVSTAISATILKLSITSVHSWWRIFGRAITLLHKASVKVTTANSNIVGTYRNTTIQLTLTCWIRVAGGKHGQRTKSQWSPLFLTDLLSSTWVFFQQLWSRVDYDMPQICKKTQQMPTKNNKSSFKNALCGSGTLSYPYSLLILIKSDYILSSSHMIHKFLSPLLCSLAWF